MLDLDTGTTTFDRHEPDLDLGRIGSIPPEVPAVHEPGGGLPGEDLAPIVLGAGGRPLEDAATGPAFEG